jgi:hypothetical protein
MSAKVIDLFTRKPAVLTDDEREFWKWGEEYVSETVLNLQAITQDIDTADTEMALMRALQELKDEVGKIPGLE